MEGACHTLGISPRNRGCPARTVRASVLGFSLVLSSRDTRTWLTQRVRDPRKTKQIASIRVMDRGRGLSSAIGERLRLTTRLAVRGEQQAIGADGHFDITWLSLLSCGFPWSSPR